MNAYNEFKALPVAERDAICAEKMGWHLEPTADSLMEWATDGGGRGRLEADWNPTTDRNDAAMMVEKVRDRRRMPDLLMFLMGEGHPNSFLEAVEIGLRADPCLIAWAACVALEDA